MNSNWGGVREGAGRPKGSLNKGEKKNGRIVISCTKKEEEQIKKIAKKMNKNVSSFIIEKILENNRQ